MMTEISGMLGGMEGSDGDIHLADEGRVRDPIQLVGVQCLARGMV